MSDYQIAPSILSADFARLGEEVDNVLAAGADIVHFDVMDNHYVPNLTIGPLVCEALRKHGVEAPIDVHLMVKPVDRIIPDFASAGASYITFHPEASEHIDRSLSLIRDSGCRSGLVFNPATPLSYLDYVLDKVDMVLLMSVNPGFGGQSFIPGFWRAEFYRGNAGQVARGAAHHRRVRLRYSARNRRRRQGRQYRGDCRRRRRYLRFGFRHIRLRRGRRPAPL
jgi:ribulose-phosphate 3-epimerase